MLYLTRQLIRKLPGQIIKAVSLSNPKIISYFGATCEVGSICKENNFKNVLLITDQTIYSLNLHKNVVASLEKEDISYTIFSNIASEPNLKIIDEGRKALLEHKADAIIALGGGAVMDSSKMIAAAGKLKNVKSKYLLKKFLIVKNKTIPMINIPTTAGTGAEITVGAVITNQKSQKKCSVIVGLNIVGVILDGELTIKTPNSITCACAIDALSHGLEGIVASVISSEEDIKKSKECVKLVLNNLPILIDNPSDQDARQNMALAANFGGNAINKQLAGYVHAFAHSIGGKYHLPHGNAIALCLLPVMEFQKQTCLEALADLSRYCSLSEKDDNLTAANKLLQAIENLIKLCNFKKPEGILKNNDFKSLAKAICLDSINYSSPTVLNNKHIYMIFKTIKGGLN